MVKLIMVIYKKYRKEVWDKKVIKMIKQKKAYLAPI